MFCNRNHSHQWLSREECPAFRRRLEFSVKAFCIDHIVIFHMSWGHSSLSSFSFFPHTPSWSFSVCFLVVPVNSDVMREKSIKERRNEVQLDQGVSSSIYRGWKSTTSSVTSNMWVLRSYVNEIEPKLITVFQLFLNAKLLRNSINYIDLQQFNGIPKLKVNFWIDIFLPRSHWN